MENKKVFEDVLLNKSKTFGVSKMKNSEEYEFERFSIIQLIDALSVLDTVKTERTIVVGFRKGYPLFLCTDESDRVGMALSPIGDEF